MYLDHPSSCLSRCPLATHSLLVHLHLERYALKRERGEEGGEETSKRQMPHLDR